MINPQDATDKDIAFLRDAARFFEHAAVNTGEDRSFWANTYNAESCRRIADRLAALSGGIETPAREGRPDDTLNDIAEENEFARDDEFNSPSEGDDE